MRKKILSSLCMLCNVILCMTLLIGCGSTIEGEESVIYVDKKGTITFLDVHTFEESYYDESELKDDIDAAVEEYNQEHEKGAVKVGKLTVDDQVAKLEMKFKTAEDYSELIGMELYQDKVVTALAEGHSFDVDFAKVEDGQVTGSATKQDIYGESDLKVVIIKANINVRVEGEICYVSSENVEVTGTDSVTIGGEDDSVETDVYTYIIYK